MLKKELPTQLYQGKSKLYKKLAEIKFFQGEINLRIHQIFSLREIIPWLKEIKTSDTHNIDNSFKMRTLANFTFLIACFNNLILLTNAWNNDMGKDRCVLLIYQLIISQSMVLVWLTISSRIIKQTNKQTNPDNFF